MQSISYSQFRENLAQSLDSVVDDHEPIRVTRRAGKAAIVVSEDDWRGMQETWHLLRSPANARRLAAALAEADAGVAKELNARTLVDADSAGRP